MNFYEKWWFSIFVFEKSLESGIDLIDEQHKKIFEVANIFFVCFEHGHADRKAPETISFLSQYILYHFAVEEAYLSSSQYPKYREHQARHNYLSTQLKFHSVNLERSNYSIQAVRAFHDFFKDWVERHIFCDDVEFFEYFREHQNNAKG